MDLDSFRIALETSAVYFRGVQHRYVGLLYSYNGSGWEITSYSIIWLYDMFREYPDQFEFARRSRRYV